MDHDMKTAIKIIFVIMAGANADPFHAQQLK